MRCFVTASEEIHYVYLRLIDRDSCQGSICPRASRVGSRRCRRFVVRHGANRSCKTLAARAMLARVSTLVLAQCGTWHGGTSALAG
jgi:hypothetical protein